MERQNRPQIWCLLPNASKVEFTSVLINIASPNYSENYNFRSYCAISDDTGTYYVYGGYTVAKNIHDIAGQVKAGSEWANFGQDVREYINSILGE